VSDNEPHPGKFLATRLDHLFRTIHPGRGKPFTPADVAQAINEAAGEQVTSGTYVWQLRTGTATWYRVCRMTGPVTLIRQAAASPGDQRATERAMRNPTSSTRNVG
jgi:hypothetical protein